MDEQKAIEKLQRQIDLIKMIKSKPDFSPEFEKWKRDTEVAIERIFGKKSRHLSDFDFNYHLVLVTYLAPDNDFTRQFPKALDSVTEVLKSMVEEIKEYGLESESSSTVKSPSLVLTNSRKVFIVHGRDDAAKLAVTGFIEKLDLISIILHEQANEGKTIIEKFEKHSEVGFAVVLLTPDDVGGLSSDKEQLKPRARQNVILELGYFLGKLGRKNVCALYKEGVEIPSDYDGVLFIPMDSGNGWKLQLAKEIKTAGIVIDLNKAI